MSPVLVISPSFDDEPTIDFVAPARAPLSIDAVISATLECEGCDASVPVSFPVIDGEPQLVEATCATCEVRYACEHDTSDVEPGEAPRDRVIVVRWWCRHGCTDIEECAECDAEQAVRS